MIINGTAIRPINPNGVTNVKCCHILYVSIFLMAIGKNRLFPLMEALFGITILHDETSLQQSACHFQNHFLKSHVGRK